MKIMKYLRSQNQFIGYASFQLIDLVKLVLAFAVISIHCDISTEWLISKFVFLSVPFFFSFSGFFIYQKINEEGLNYLLRYIFKCFMMFLAWSVIYLPLTILGSLEEHKDLFHNIVIIIRSTLFTGQNYMSWPLWYLHSLLFSSVVILFMLKKRCSFSAIFIFSILLYILGYVLNYIHENGVNIEPIAKSVEIFFAVALNTKLLQSLVYITSGMILAKYLFVLVKFKWFLFLLGMAMTLCVPGNLPLVQCIATALMSVLFIGQTLSIELPYFWFRKMSTAIYFSHMYFIALEKYFFNSIYEVFCSRYFFAAFTTFLFSALLVSVSGRYKQLRFLL